MDDSLGIADHVDFIHRVLHDFKGDADASVRAVAGAVGCHNPAIPGPVTTPDLGYPTLAGTIDLLGAGKRPGICQALLELPDGSADVGRRQIEYVLSRRREAANPQLAIQQDCGDAGTCEEIGEVRVRWSEFPAT
jgi:hypothetical protein